MVNRPVTRVKVMLLAGASVAALLATGLTGTAIADPHPAAPALSSRPGAAYTIYLDFSGFNYTGIWGGQTPGDLSAYDNVASTGTFSSSDISQGERILNFV